MSENAEIAIKVQGVSKCYHIYQRPHDRLKQFILPRLQKLTGRTVKPYFNSFMALDEVSFEIKKGETVGIIGRNGSGKSTLLQIICGTLSPTFGTIEINGRVAALLELGAGFNAEFTGRENVYMNASIFGLSRKEIDARFPDILEFADIGQFIDQPVKTYSSGMYVRLAFAIIAHVDADILVIDEALSVGDAFFTQKCMRFLRKFMETGTVLFVSHDTAAVTNLCNRAIWLQQGKVKFSGLPKTASELYLAAQFQSTTDNKTEVLKKPSDLALDTQDFYDMRRDFINNSSLRNDIEVFKFALDTASFGKGGATITSVKLLDLDNRPVSWIIGGEDVQLHIVCKAHIALISPIVGFLVNDRLGQPLFGDNTFLTYLHTTVSIAAEQEFVSRFQFRMPILPKGDYSITVAITEGSQIDHTPQHWIHDALILKSHSSSVCTGLVGVPMNHIEINIYE